MTERRKIAISKRESKVATRLHRVICVMEVVSFIYVSRGEKETDLSTASMFEGEFCGWATGNA
jgi:hypothetical protein